MTAHPSEMPDLEFLEAFERADIPAHAFGHREHLRMAWLYLVEHGPERAETLASDGIRRLATAHGVPQKYHHTVSVAWARLVAHHQRRWPEETFHRFLEGSSGLLDKRLLLGHYRSRTLASVPARTGWVEPDLAPLPR